LGTFGHAHKGEKRKQINVETRGKDCMEKMTFDMKRNGARSMYLYIITIEFSFSLAS